MVFAFSQFACKKQVVDAVEFVVPDAENENTRVEGKYCESQTSEYTFENNKLTFSPEHMLCVSIQIDSSGFYTLRNETRFGPSITENQGVTLMAMFFDYLRNCDVPWPQRYNWYTASINIDGIQKQNIGIRKRGFLGSTFSIAPSLNIRTERNISNNSYRETNRIILNNNTEDETRIKSSLNFKVFEMAGYPAPKCHLANVRVNNELLGAYSHLEAIDEAFLKDRFGTDAGYLYEGTIVDFIEGRELRWDAKSDAADADRTGLRKVAAAINVDDVNLENELGSVVNIEAYIRFWALEVLLEHTDGYSSNCNNFYVYFNPNDNGKAHFIPWGMNYFQVAEQIDTVGEENPLNTYLRSELSRRLSRVPKFNSMFIDELKRWLDEVWDEEYLLNLIGQMADQVKSAEENSDYDTQVQELKEWVKNRRSQIEYMIEQGLPEGNKNPPRSCLW